jgi:DNA-binding NarL/FixJ family response regulator
MAEALPVRVVIIDDDEWIRRGRADALRDLPGIDVTTILDHHDALAFGAGWDSVDVALVDARDDNQAWDKFPGVSVVEAIRARRDPEQTTVIVISGHMLNDVLRLRMHEAGADFFYSHDEVRNVEQLATVIEHPSSGRRASPPSSSGLSSAGLTPKSTPNAALA